MEVIKRFKVLESDFPGLSASMMVVSCDENIPDVADYVTSGAGPQSFLIETEKDHVMVCLHVAVDGRAGVLLCDPGYHVARLVTVMHDRCYPHTGWFVQSEEAHSRKEYCYTAHALNASYVEWRERDVRAAGVKEQTSLVYVARAYLRAVDVTERRNLVWNFRSLLSRDPKGRLVAGIYFPVKAKDQDFTMFFEDNSGKQKMKLKFSDFLDPQKIPEALVQAVGACNEQLRYGEGALLALLKRLAAIMADQDFVHELLALNLLVVQLSAGAAHVAPARPAAPADPDAGAHTDAGAHNDANIGTY